MLYCLLSRHIHSEHLPLIFHGNIRDKYLLLVPDIFTLYKRHLLGYRATDDYHECYP